MPTLGVRNEPRGEAQRTEAWEGGDCPVMGHGWGREQKERKGVGEAEKIQEGEHGT